ncbi:3341_t:CDS:2, partial [Paraglomus brasilianum]
NIAMDSINFASAFNNLDLNILSSTKEEIHVDAKQDLGLHQKNGKEEQKRKESLQAEEKQQNQLSTDDYESEWNQNHHNLLMGCSLLPLHEQLSPPKEKEKKIPTFRSSQRKISRRERNSHIKISLQRETKGLVDCIPTRERPIPSSSRPGWECDSNSRTLGVRELRGNECLDFFMPVENRSPYQVSNSVINNGGIGNNEAMPKLPSLSDLVDALKNDKDNFCEFHEPTDKWIVDQEHKKYFSDTYGITNIHPLFVGCYGMVVLFLDDRGIVFTWCEMTHDMCVLGFNIMEGLANYVCHQRKRCFIMEDTGELITKAECERRTMEEPLILLV